MRDLNIGQLDCSGSDLTSAAGNLEDVAELIEEVGLERLREVLVTGVRYTKYSFYILLSQSVYRSVKRSKVNHRNTFVIKKGKGKPSNRFGKLLLFPAGFC